MRKPVLLLPAIILCLLPSLGSPTVKAIFGWVETVEIGPQRTELAAKLDTGATTSSVDAREIQRFRRGGKRYVRFTIPDGKGNLGDSVEKPLVRIVRIKRHDGDYQRRPVVKLNVCLGDLLREVEFTLVNRETFDHAVLLGRNLLDGFAVVDPELDHTSQPSCGVSRL